MDTEITDEFQHVLDLLSVATPPVVFVTGSAGTGKSTLIDVLRYELDKNLVVVAPTGVAALNVQGQTIHSLFQLPPGPQPRAKRIAGAAKDVVEKMEVLVIDGQTFWTPLTIRFALTPAGQAPPLAARP